MELVLTLVPITPGLHVSFEALLRITVKSS